MDCGAGAAIGQAFQQSVMHGGFAGGPDEFMMREHDDVMAGAGHQHADPAWAAEFDAQRHHHAHHAAMHQQHMVDEFEAMAMHEAFEGQQHQPSEAEAYEDAYHGDDWLGQFTQDGQTEGEQWAQDYNDTDVQVFTVEGEPLRTVEEKTQQSEFYGMLEKIKKQELVIDEDAGEIVAGPGPAAAEAEWQAQFAAAQQDAAFLRTHEDGWAQEHLAAGGDSAAMEEAWNAEEDAYQKAWGSDEADADDYANQFLGGGVDGEPNDEWFKEYEQMQQDLRNAQDSTDYPFEQNNPYLFHDDPFTEGVELQAQGNLAEAVLAFEAACQKNMTRQEAWRVLGTTQAENEKDQLAIRALNKARELNPKDILVHAALAVSHTNESNHAQALRALKDWLLSHSEYEHLGTIAIHGADGAVDAVDESDYATQFLFVSPSEHRDCTILFQAAVQLNPSDVDLHSSLGVLKNLSHEYDDAAAHFRDAIQLRGDDPKLWNKLGATLANGNRSREALEAYDRALDLNPGYVRAQYNLGIAHSNLGEHALAAKQLLRAIVMQQGGVTNSADGGNGGTGRSTREMWDVLRMTLNLMDRPDLVDLTWKQDVVPFLPEFGLEELL